MKTTLLNTSIFCLALTAAMASEARMEKGTQEVGLQGNLDLDAQDDYQLNLDFSYGYFIKDNWEIGLQLDGTASDSYKLVNLGVFTEYNFNNDSKWVPFFGTAASVGSADYDDDRSDSFDTDFEDADALSLDFSLGIKYFVNDNVAISAEFIHTISTDDIHLDGDDVKDSAQNILFGTRFYF